MRLDGKTAIIIGAGQASGEAIGNGRATALRFAQEGDRIMVVDRNLSSAEETAAMIAFTKQVAIQNAEYGIRANAILPGLMDTPMAVDTRVQVTCKTRTQVAAERDARVPLRHKMGTGWDVANAALFLASDEANYITGVELLVDGGGSLMVG